MNIYSDDIYSEIIEDDAVYNHTQWAQRKVSRAQRRRRSRKAKEQRRETYFDSY